VKVSVDKDALTFIVAGESGEDELSVGTRKKKKIKTLK
jgi:hypothetical protein